MTKTHAEEAPHPSVIPASTAGTEIHHRILRSIKHLYGNSLGTADGEIGTVKDLYLDDQKWAIRYVVADTGSWLPGRLVLISPHAFGDFHAEESDSLLVSLTRQQIENSPAIETHKPVSRQFEEEYYRYYGWPTYWAGSGMWGMGGFPMVPPPPLVPPQVENGDADVASSDDPHLRSTQALSGYHIETPEGAIGHVSDFLIDPKSWAIRHLVVETGHWFSGKEIVISPEQIERISFEESKVFVNVSKQTIENAPGYEVSALGVA